MESWSYASSQGNKGFVLNGALSSPDVLARTRNMIMGWNLSDLLVPDHRSGEDVRSFRELGLPEPPPKHLQSSDSIRDGLSFKAGGSSYGSSSRDSFIDLKLGRFADQKSAPSSNAVPKFSPPPVVPAKKARMANLNPQAPPLCQVHGCNKDLTSSKDYHKRHRVCKDHSITPRVIVNGFEQRFCQQCSRFHLLAEFDNGKRSCRKRLAGHNERRRKPQLGIPGRGGRFLPSYNGFDRNALCGTASGSFICQDILNNGLLYPKTIGTSSCWSDRRIKLEPAAADFGGATAYAHPSSSLDTHHSSSLFHDHGDIAAGSFFINRHPHEEPRLVSRALLHFGGEDLVSYGTTPSSFQGFPGIADSSCALSLLSSQPQKNSPSSQPPGIPAANNHSNSITGLAIDSHYGAGQISDEAASFSSPGMMASAAAKTHLGSGVFIPQGHGVASFEVADGLFHGTDLVHAKERFSCQDGATIDLLQLSSQLHRVEQQRQEDDAFCCLRIT